jgi:hypothetical protein
MRSMIILAGLVLATPAFAGFDSAYTDFILEDTKNCTNTTPPVEEGEPADFGSFTCKGYTDYVVMFAEGDLRSSVAFGTKVADHCASSQSLPGFNSVGKKIEWRLKDGKPVATILRWFESFDPNDSTRLREWLIVTKLDVGNSCHMGYVEGGFPNANERARSIADQAERYNCVTSAPTVFAKPGQDVSHLTERRCSQ